MSSTERVVTAQGKQKLSSFLASLARLTDEEARDEAALLHRGKEILHAFVQHDDWLEDEFARPNPERYQQYLIHCDPRCRFSVVSFVWGPGQRTPIHDHTTWGLIGMLRGAEISQAYDFLAGKLVAGKVQRLEPGDVAMVSPAIGDIHCVRNAFEDRVSISVHVYGGDIGSMERHAYPSEGGVKSFVSGYANRVLENIRGMP
jgi:predicted metal-dependent enzyme (double-stranded beta helix superfamily)